VEVKTNGRKLEVHQYTAMVLPGKTHVNYRRKIVTTVDKPDDI
jgi:hypothetical protein